MISSLWKRIGSWIRGAYLGLNRVVVEPGLLSLVFSSSRLKKSRQDRVRLKHLAVGATQVSSDRIWYHAASVGELETLWPLVVKSAERGVELVITILSESADRSLESLIAELNSRSALILFSGYAPWEGYWGEYLDRLQPGLFVTARYEAWPDLWMSLAERTIPLAVVSASDRKSLRLAQRLCFLMGQDVPRLLFFACTSTDREGLLESFPSSDVKELGDPRWDRVYERSQRRNPRAYSLIQGAQSLPRPWGVLGSAWMEDLTFLFPRILDRSGTFWIVPHRVDADSVNPIRDFLRDQGLRVTMSDGIQSTVEGSPTAILVNEIGFLSELYSAADWAWVGGGFGRGIHSTLEPAIYGIPVGVGPRGTARFAEVDELARCGQLSVLSEPSELERWVASRPSPEMHEKWRKEAHLRLGAGDRILSELFSRLK